MFNGFYTIKSPKLNFTDLSYKCPTCKKSNNRLVRSFKPKDFHPQGKKSILSVFQCNYCDNNISLRYDFNIDGDARLLHYIDPNSVLFSDAFNKLHTQEVILTKRKKKKEK